MISGLRALLPVLREEPPLLALLPTVTLFLVLRHRWLRDLSGPAWAAFLFVWLFAATVGGAKTVVRHADVLAFRLGKPYGTLILTMSVASIEIVTVVVVMLTGKQNPTLGRDTMFSVLMIVLNGLVGLGLLLGGLRYREQAHNLHRAVRQRRDAPPLGFPGPIGMILRGRRPTRAARPPAPAR